MVKFIYRQGQDKVLTIDKQGEEEFKKEKDTFIAAEKERLANEYKTRLAQDEIKLKIQKSASENQARIQRMKTVNTFVEKLYKESKNKMVERQKNEPKEYKEFLKNLIV